MTKGGIRLPEESQGKALQATVVAVGSGTKGKGGEIPPIGVEAGDTVFLQEYGGTNSKRQDCFLCREDDILRKSVD